MAAFAAALAAEKADQLAVMSCGIEAKDVKFLGIVSSFNKERKHGLVSSAEAHVIWGQEIYAYQDVLAFADAQVGDAIRFGVHVNSRGAPQVSLPIYKVAPDGSNIGMPEGTYIVNCEEISQQDPTFLEKLKAEIEGKSQQQNQKRGRGGGDWGTGSAMKKYKDGEAWERGNDSLSWTSASFGGGWGGGWGTEITLHASGLPAGATQREVGHIFRQYAGFQNCRVLAKEDHTLAFVTYATLEQAQFVGQALEGYLFDEDAPPGRTNTIRLQPART